MGAVILEDLQFRQIQIPEKFELAVVQKLVKLQKKTTAENRLKVEIIKKNREKIEKENAFKIIKIKSEGYRDGMFSYNKVKADTD